MLALKAVVFLVLSFSVQAYAAGDTATPMPPDFEKLKSLVGTWEGTSKGEKSFPVTSVYELTSGGTVVMEKLMPGSPHEMVSVYHRKGKSLAMTHYCAGGTQPRMQLEKADAKSLKFVLHKTDGLDSADESHMHEVTLTLLDADTLQEDWVAFEKGKANGGHSFVLKRKK